MTTIHRALPTGLAPADPDELLRLTLLLAHDERLPELLDLTSPERSWTRLEATDLTTRAELLVAITERSIGVAEGGGSTPLQ